MPDRPRHSDGTPLSTHADLRDELGLDSRGSPLRFDRLVILRATQQGWSDRSLALAESFRNRTPKASESREFERALGEVEALGAALDAHRGAVPLASLDEALASSARIRSEGVPMTDTDIRTDDPTREAFVRYLRSGDESELRAQGVATGSAGGYFVPRGFRNTVIETMKAYGSVRSLADTITTTTGNDLEFPTNNDTANVGAILSENTQATEQDVVLGQKTLRAYAYTSKTVRVSLQLLQDSAFDLDSWLARQLGVRIARAQNAHFTTGTGTAQPEGVQTNAAIGKTGATGQTTGVVYDDLVDLVHSVDPAYRANPADCAWMMGDAAFGVVRKLKDGQQRPLLEPNLQTGQPDMLLGYRVAVNNDMPAMGASVKSILFGNFRAYYVVRDALDFQLLRMVERYADFLQHGFLGWQRSDAIVQDAAAVKAYANSAT